MVEIPTGPPPRSSYLDERGRIISPLVVRDVPSIPRGFVLPTPAQMSALDPDELNALLQRFGVQRPWAEMAEQNAEYVARMSDIPPGSPELDAEVERITSSASTRGQLALARRTQERWTTMAALEAVGDPDHELIRISEDDDDTCDGCLSRAGAIGTLAEQEAIGGIGAASCYGGDMCRCQYVLFK